MKDKVLLNNLNYHQRRVCGQLASLPCSWRVILDDDDVAIAVTLRKLGLLESDFDQWRATDEGRKRWQEFRTQEPAP